MNMNYEFYMDLMNTVSNGHLRNIIFYVCIRVSYHSTKVVGLIAMFKKQCNCPTQ